MKTAFGELRRSAHRSAGSLGLHSYNHILFAFPCQPHFEEDLVQSLRSLYTREIFPRNWLFVCDCVCYTDAMRKNTNDVYKRRNDQIPIQAMKYGLAAFGGFLADYAVLLLLKEWVGLHYLIAVPIAFTAGIAVNYLIGIWLVFQRGNLTLGKELLLFVVISLVALLITEGSMYLLTDLLGIDYRVSRIISGVLTYLFNFFTRRFLLYREKPLKERE